MQMNGGGIRVFHHEEIGEHFKGAIRHLLSKKGVVESAIVESQKNSLVVGDTGVDRSDARNFRGNAFQYQRKAILVLTFQDCTTLPILSPWMFRCSEARRSASCGPRPDGSKTDTILSGNRGTS